MSLAGIIIFYSIMAVTICLVFDNCSEFLLHGQDLLLHLSDLHLLRLNLLLQKLDLVVQHKLVLVHCAHLTTTMEVTVLLRMMVVVLLMRMMVVVVLMRMVVVVVLMRMVVVRMEHLSLQVHHLLFLC